MMPWVQCEVEVACVAVEGVAMATMAAMTPGEDTINGVGTVDLPDLGMVDMEVAMAVVGTVATVEAEAKWPWEVDTVVVLEGVVVVAEGAGQHPTKHQPQCLFSLSLQLHLTNVCTISHTVYLKYS